MESILAVAGFWIFMIVAVVKWGDVRRARAFASKPSDLEALKARLIALESQLSTMGTELLELKDGRDFALKLLEEKKSPASKN